MLRASGRLQSSQVSCAWHRLDTTQGGQGSRVRPLCGPKRQNSGFFLCSLSTWKLAVYIRRLLQAEECDEADAAIQGWGSVRAL